MTDQNNHPELSQGDKPSSLQNSGPADCLTENSGEGDLTRREMMKIAAAALIAAPMIQMPAAQAAGKATAANANLVEAEQTLRFFTPQEFALVDELTELIIPSDDHSPGARAAKVAAYIDARMAESFTEEPKLAWRNGLKLVEALSQEMHGRDFFQATPEQRIALLTRMAKNEGNPQKPEEIFFGELKGRTVRGYYSSKIGIHEEMEYKGNTYQKEYAGYDAT